MVKSIYNKVIKKKNFDLAGLEELDDWNCFLHDKHWNPPELHEKSIWLHVHSILTASEKIH